MTLRIEHSSPDRARARELFERLSKLPADDDERLRIRSELVELHLPLVEYLARRFRNRGEWLDDLTQVATIGLIKSIDRFDLDRGVEFSTYATPTIVGEIKRHFRDKGWAVRVPRRLQELKLALTKAIGDLAQREGRAPTVAEIAAHLQMTEEEVLEGLESANAYSTVSLDAPDSGDDDAPAVAEPFDLQLQLLDLSNMPPHPECDAFDHLPAQVYVGDDLSYMSFEACPLLPVTSSTHALRFLLELLEERDNPVPVQIRIKTGLVLIVNFGGNLLEIDPAGT